MVSGKRTCFMFNRMSYMCWLVFLKFLNFLAFAIPMWTRVLFLIYMFLSLLDPYLCLFVAILWNVSMRILMIMFPFSCHKYFCLIRKNFCFSFLRQKTLYAHIDLEFFVSCWVIVRSFVLHAWIIMSSEFLFLGWSFNLYDHLQFTYDVFFGWFYICSFYRSFHLVCVSMLTF